MPRNTNALNCRIGDEEACWAQLLEWRFDLYEQTMADDSVANLGTGRIGYGAALSQAEAKQKTHNNPGKNDPGARDPAQVPIDR
jgi:hypothetical protein